MKKLFLYLTILILSAIVQNNKLLAAEQAGPEQAAAKAAGVPAKAGAASQAAAGGPMAVGAVPGGAGAGGAAGAGGTAKIETKKHTPEQIEAVTKRLFEILKQYDSTEIDAKEIKSLIENGANVNAILHGDYAYMNFTPLMLAVINKESKPGIEIIRLLLKHGANVNVKSPNVDYTPLMEAARENSKAKVKLLLDYGADPFIKNNQGKTFFDIANRPFENALEAYREHEEFKKKRTDAIRAADSLSVYPRPVADIIGEYAGHPEND